LRSNRWVEEEKEVKQSQGTGKFSVQKTPPKAKKCLPSTKIASIASISMPRKVKTQAYAVVGSKRPIRHTAKTQKAESAEK
jgi:hypothetical protein